MSIVDVEFGLSALNNKPRLVIRQNRAGAVEFRDVKCASLGTWRSQNHLLRKKAE
jgi:hypothetical protein